MISGRNEGGARKDRIGRGFKVIAGSAVVLLSLSGPAWARYEPPPPCRNPFTPEQEVTEGAKVAAKVYQVMPVLPESDPVARYVTQLGAHLVQHAPGAKWPYSFHVVASSDVNAFALPGGAVFVNLGTIQAAQTEAQLAGVMSHEISHVILRHATCNIGKQQTRSIGYGIGGILSQILLGNSTAGQVVQTGLSSIQGLEFLHMSRESEKEADLLGTGILYDSGYDPRGLPQFFETIKAKYGAGGAQMLSDHPDPGNRTQYVNAEIATLPPRPNPMVNSAAFARMHSLAMQEPALTAEQVKAGTWKNSSYATGPGPSAGVYGNPAQTNGSGRAGSPADAQPNGGGTGEPRDGDRRQQPGADTNGQVAPAGGGYPVPLSPAQLGLAGPMGTYRGPTFEIGYPARWRTSTEANDTLTVFPQGGAGAFGLSYGAVVGLQKESGNGISDFDGLSAATMTVARQLSDQNGGLQQVGQVGQVTIRGQGAATLELRGKSPLVENGRSMPEREWLVTIARPDGDINYIVFVCPERDFAQLRPAFVKMMSSFRPL